MRSSLFEWRESRRKQAPRHKRLADFYRKIWARGDAGAEIPLDMMSPATGTLDIRTVTVHSLDRYDWLRLDKGL